MSAEAAEIEEAIDNYEDICPHWFMARNHDTMIENSTHPYHDQRAIFAVLGYQFHKTFNLYAGTWWDVNNNADSSISDAIQEIDVWLGGG